MSRFISMRKIILSLIIGSIIVGFLGFVLYTKPLLRLQLVQSPLVQFFLHTYRSLRKVADIPYLPYQFVKDDLPVYDITINVVDIARMNAALPDDFVKGRLTDKYKLEVRASFSADGYEDRINIRYRGRGPNHWNAYKKSFHVQFDSDNPFHGTTALKLIIPEDRQYAVEPLNNYRAKKLGLFAPQPWFVRVRLNGEDLGVYHAIPHWTRALTDRNGFGEFANIFGVIDLQLAELTGKNFFDPANISFWEDYTRNADINPPTSAGGGVNLSAKERLTEFLNIIHHAPDELFEQALPVLVDMDALYDWLIIQTLAASAHQNTAVNIILLYNPATGRFQPVPWDAQLYLYHPINLATHPLIGRTLQNLSFRQEYLNRLRTYVEDPKNLEADLLFFDTTRNQIEHALFKDTAKLPLNFQVTRDLQEDRKLIEQNFKTVQTLFAQHREQEIIIGEYTRHEPKPSLEISDFLRDATKNTALFIKEHPQFHSLKTGSSTLTLGPGRIVFSKTIIMPVGTNLVIQPGTIIFMNEGSSLIVYGRVEARGTATHPIAIRALTNKTWGNLLVLGNEAQKDSVFEYISMSGGSGFYGNGITATGMLALHKTGGSITRSVFENTHDDDAINIKYGKAIITNNTFRTLFGDAIDLDSVIGEAVISNNIFGDFGFAADKGNGPNGDGIDISFTTARIENNTVSHCGDKGISVGEESRAVITNNIIKNCAIGISIKDLSEAIIENTILEANSVGIEAKQKKPLFGGGFVKIKDVVFKNNEQDTIVDSSSILTTY